MNYRKLYHTLLAVGLLALMSPAFASDKYCSDEAETHRVYFAPKANMTVDEQNSAKTALEIIFRNLAVGDKLELFIASDNGVNRSFSSCFPGCPEEGMLSQFFGLGGGCKATLAKKHRLEFTNDYITNVKNILDAAGSGSQGYKNILATLNSINSHSATISDLTSNTSLVSSMYVSNTVAEEELDKFFVETIQNNRLPNQFPNITVSGLPINSDLINLWEDLYKLRGQSFSYK